MDGLQLPADDTGSKYGRRYRSSSPSRRPSFAPRLRRQFPLFFCVLLPTILAGIYYFGFAANQYVSEARFVVRGANALQPGVWTTLLAGVGHGQDDTFSVQDYILSRDALRELVDHEDLRTIFARPEADPLSRFPTALTGDSFEHLFKYYLKQVDVSYDATTGVSALTVKAFRAADAQRIAQALLVAGERLVNRMNERERENTLKTARLEVSRAEAHIEALSAEIAAFRNRETVIDPDKQSVSMLQGIAELQSRLATTRTQIAELTKSSPNSPLLVSAERRANALQTQITDAQRKVAGTDNSMVPKITEYDRLTLERGFADRELTAATDSLAAARLQAERQELYLDPIVQPNEADYPAYPKRFASIAVVFATCFGLYTAARLLIAGAREHRAS
jgi:capsular polysaccharide transport system permease protein